MKESEKLAIVGVVIVALLVFLVLFSIYESNLTGEGQQNQNVSGTGNMDRFFIENMIPHHQDAVDMANIALVKAEHPEIKQLARNIKSSQSREISEMPMVQILVWNRCTC